MPQGKFRALEVPEAGGGLEDAHGEEQHQQTVPNRFHGVVDGDNGDPDGAAPEALRSGGDKGPYLRHFVIPGIHGRLQISNDPVIAQKVHLLMRLKLSNVIKLKV